MDACAEIRGKWSFRWWNGSSDFSEKGGTHKNIHPFGTQDVQKPEMFTRNTVLQTCNLLVMPACFVSAKLERNLGYCLRRDLPSKLSHCGLFAPPGPQHSHYLSPDSPSSASSFEISLKIAARSFPHLTLSPSSSARSKHFTHLPETIPSQASRYR